MNTFDVGRKQLTDKPIIPVVDTRYLKQILVIVLGLVSIIMIVLMNHACHHLSCHCILPVLHILSLFIYIEDITESDG